MALNINTTKNIKKASNALSGKCEKTKKDMKKLMAEAGCGEYKTVKVHIPLPKGDNDDVLFIGLNGISFYFMKGQTVDMPEPLYEVAKNCEVL